jgi:hypothetical protein
MLTLRDAIPKPQPLASAEFTTVRLRLVKIAARVIETATRVRIAFTASCPEAELLAASPAGSSPPPHDAGGTCPRTRPHPSTPSASTIRPELATKAASGSRVRRSPRLNRGRAMNKMG